MGGNPLTAKARANYTGAAHEHFAAAMFLRDGWDIHWPGMQHGPADFIASRGSRQFLRVQVKTASVVKSRPGRKLAVSKVGDTGSYDLLVVVDPQWHRVWRIPAPLLNTDFLYLGEPGVGKSTKWDSFIVLTSQGTQ